MYKQDPFEHFIHQRGAGIRHSLKQLAEAKWPKQTVLGFVPVRSYRIRQQANSDNFTWWIERDIPPYDRFHCEAYLVRIVLNRYNQITLNVISGNKTYPVLDPTETNVDRALEKVAHDPPLVIPRRMGVAFD